MMYLFPFTTIIKRKLINRVARGGGNIFKKKKKKKKKNRKETSSTLKSTLWKVHCHLQSSVICGRWCFKTFSVSGEILLISLHIRREALVTRATSQFKFYKQWKNVEPIEKRAILIWLAQKLWELVWDIT